MKSYSIEPCYELDVVKWKTSIAHRGPKKRQMTLCYSHVFQAQPRFYRHFSQSPNKLTLNFHTGKTSPQKSGFIL